MNDAKRVPRGAAGSGESAEQYPRLGEIVARIWARHLREQAAEQAKGEKAS